MSKTYNSIIILGPTASGKTKLAANLAYRVNGAVLSFDSRQVYRNLNIGTGKDLAEFTINNYQVPYYLIDCCDVNENFHNYEFIKQFIASFKDCITHDKTPVLCGGTGLYFDLVLKKHQNIMIPINNGLREILENETHESLILHLKDFPVEFTAQADISTRKRLIRAIEIASFLTNNTPEKIPYPEIKPILFGTFLNSTERNKNIENRLNNRLKEGLIEEVEQLLESGIPADRLIFLGLEYRYLTEYILGKYDKPTMVHLLQTAIRQYAKRQMTWFRKMEREGHVIHWIDATLSVEQQLNSIKEFL